MFLLLTLASVSGLSLGPSDHRVGGTHLNVMVCEFGPKFSACTKVQQGHLGTRMVKEMLGVHQGSPLSIGGGLGPSLPPYTLSPPARVPAYCLPGLLASGLHNSKSPPHEAEGTWLLFIFWS